MKAKIIAIAALSAVIVAGIIVSRNHKMSENMKTIKVALSGDLPKDYFNPENISTIALYHFHMNIWDTLLSADKNAAIARSFKISDDHLRYTFEISENAKFSNGRKITAQDIKSSIDRVVSREQSGHLNAKSIIKNVEATSSSQIVVSLNSATPAFLFLLTSPEFAIIPTEAMDANGNINSLEITSGSYTVTKVDLNRQTAILKKNPYFLRHYANSSDLVELSFINNIGASTNPEILNQYDFVEVRSSDSEEIVRKAQNSGFKYKSTIPSLSVFLVADKSLPISLSKFFAGEFRRNFQFQSPLGFEKRSTQFFPAKTFGSLSDGDIEKISFPAVSTKFPQKVIIRASRHTGPLVDAVVSIFKNVGVNVEFVEMDHAGHSDYMFISQGMNTEYPEIELHLSIVGPYADFQTNEHIKGLVQKAMHQSEDSARSETIKEVGKELLSSGKIIPITTRAYVHLFKENVISVDEITNYDGDIPLYKIRLVQQ